MKNKYTYIILFIYISLLLQNNIAFSNNSNESNLEGYNLYTYRVENICKKAEYYNKSKLVYVTEEYKKPEEYKNNSNSYFTSEEYIIPLREVKNKYRENQNNIYKCGLFQSQKRGYELVKKLLKIDKSGTLRNRVENKLKTKIDLVKQESDKISCNIDDSNLSLSKKQILDNSSYEMCKYRFYLDLLENSYYKDIKNTIGYNDKNTDTSQDSYTINQFIEQQKQISNEIKNEIEQTYKVYPLAYSAYTEYESYFPIHITLELLREDFVVYRDKLYQTLNPINQTVYKIINAMTY